MKKLLILGLILSTSLLFASKETDLARKAGGGNKFGKFLNSKNPSTSPSSSSVETSGVDFDSSQVAEASCTRSKQTSLPLWVFEDLLEYDQISVGTNPATSSSSGIVQLTGGKMIGNCNSMLKMSWDINEGRNPHFFNVSVKQPVEGCSEVDGVLKCDYWVQVAEDGVTKDEKVKMSFEPNYYGFIKCLQDTGVYDKEGNLNGEKIALSNFSATKTGVNSTGAIQYYCMGSECDSKRSGSGSVANQLPKKNNCEHAQPINSNNPMILSRSENERNQKEADFRKICNSMDYKAISERLPLFNQSEYGDLYNVLEYVRDELVLKEAKKLAKAVRDKKSLAKLDADKYKDFMLDYYDILIKPTRKQIEKLHREMASLTDKNKIKQYQKAIDKLVDRLKKYTSKPYFDSNTYEKMKSFAAKAPLHKEEWVLAAQTAYKGINTAFNYARFHSKLGKKVQKAQDKKGEDYELDLTTTEANELIVKHINDEADHLEKLATLAEDSDGNVSFANEFLAEAEDVQIRHQIRMEDLQEELIEARHAQYECFNSSIGFYGFLAQSCLEDNQRLQQEIMNDIDYYSHPEYQQFVMAPTIQDSMNQANYWAGIERDRNNAYGITPKSRISQFSRDRRSFQNPNFSGNFAQNYLSNQQMARQSLANQWNNGLQSSPAWQQWNNPMQSRFPANQTWYQNQNPNQPFMNRNWMFTQPQYQQNNVPFYLRR